MPKYRAACVAASEAAEDIACVTVAVAKCAAELTMVSATSVALSVLPEAVNRRLNPPRA